MGRKTCRHTARMRLHRRDARAGGAAGGPPVFRAWPGARCRRCQRRHLIVLHDALGRLPQRPVKAELQRFASATSRKSRRRPVPAPARPPRPPAAGPARDLVADRRLFHRDEVLRGRTGPPEDPARPPTPVARHAGPGHRPGPRPPRRGPGRGTAPRPRAMSASRCAPGRHCRTPGCRAATRLEDRRRRANRGRRCGCRSRRRRRPSPAFRPDS